MCMYNDIEMHVNIIAMSGFKGSGKDTVADLLFDQYYESMKADNGNDNIYNTFYIEPMAEHIRRACNILFTSLNLEDYEHKERPNPVWSTRLKRDFSYRDMLNDVGMLFRHKYGNKFWVWATEDRFDQCLKNAYQYAKDNNVKKHLLTYIIPDIRYKQEIKMLYRFKKNYEANVEHWLILRNEALPEWVRMGLHVTDQVERKIIIKDFKPSSHEIEWCLMNPKFSRVIYNDGTIDDLKNIISPIAKSLIMHE